MKKNPKTMTICLLIVITLGCEKELKPCDSLIETVHELCGKTNNIEKTLSCYDESTLDCDKAETDISGRFDTCNEKTIINIINDSVFCDPMECPKYWIDCTDSPYYLDTGDDIGTYDMERAFDGCVLTAKEWGYVETSNGQIWDTLIGVCYRGSCASESQIIKNVCQK
ncbi:MAG: hypothetical protein GY847_07210 [Proteobacteria bacterium]|nr:hypothetical protein [Pseudomonadota bacterium]